MFDTKKTLIVVYKDEMLMNQLRKMVETNDDESASKIIGTKDGSLNIIAWTEKVWLANKKAGNITSKVLFLGDIKGNDKLIPVLDLVIDEDGIKFGWAGNQAVLFADAKQICSREKYLAFIDKLTALPVPESVKKAKHVMIGESTNFENEVDEAIIVSENKGFKNKVKSLFNATKKGVKKGVNAAGKAGNKALVKTEDITRNKKFVTQQLLFYGVVKLYHDGLERFMNS